MQTFDAILSLTLFATVFAAIYWFIVQATAPWAISKKDTK